MPSVLGIGAGQTASVDLPCGLAYFELLIRCQATIGGAANTDLAAADWSTVFGDMRILVNGDAKLTLGADFAVARAQYFGETLQAGVLPIKFYAPWMLTEHDQNATVFKTANLSTFSLEMDIKSGQTVQKLEVSARQGSLVPILGQGADNWGSHLEIHRYAKQVGITGTTQITDLPRGNWGMTALHLNTDQVTRTQVFRNDTQAYDMDVAVADTVLTEGGRVPQTGYTHIDFCADNILREGLPMNASSLNVEYNVTATGNYSLYAETLKAA